jgi:hypothetical protein
MSESKDERTNDALAGIDAAKRETLNRLITGTAFVAPIVASFAMDGLTISKAQAATANGSGFISVAPTPSDRRLKTGIARVATLPSGLGLYRFKYLWGDAEYVGVMAQEVLDVVPAAVVAGTDGFLRVDYHLLGFEMVTYQAWQEREAGYSRRVAA